MAVDFDDDVRLAKKEAIVLSTAMVVAGSGCCGEGLSWERRAANGGKSHRKPRMQRYRKKKRQRSGSQLEATATATRGRYWEGKERFVEDQIPQQKWLN
ncbi:hypothetical protein GW17_00026616 [Ensete ventricosum]|uniref:Uncharacterized protein n=1 Tax=Ensete ventricosum TaxID=4639 RepID=A0A444EHW9_ENSVE|nr:hypothetical protein GW17_00026616 [Ensete ventricosum]RZR71572.1 hypothetical protein BHM03_00005913 [Ensete ventricosum]